MILGLQSISSHQSVWVDSLMDYEVSEGFSALSCDLLFRVLCGLFELTCRLYLTEFLTNNTDSSRYSCFDY